MNSFTSPSESVMSVVASARKSKGEYKPLIKFPDGRTKVVEQAQDRFTVTPYGVYRGSGFYERGSTYAERDDAVAAAQAEIDARRAEAEARLAKHREAGRPDHPSLIREIQLWGGAR